MCSALTTLQALCSSSLISHKNPASGHVVPRWAEKETRTQRGEVTCPRSHSKEAAEPEFVPKTVGDQSQCTKWPFRVLCCLLPPPSCLVFALSQVCETQPEAKRLILYAHLRRLPLGVQPLSTPGLPLSQPPSWESLSGSALTLAWVLEACASVNEALNSFRRQIRMALGLSDLSQVLRPLKTHPYCIH